MKLFSAKQVEDSFEIEENRKYTLTLLQIITSHLFSSVYVASYSFNEIVLTHMNSRLVKVCDTNLMYRIRQRRKSACHKNSNALLLNHVISRTVKLY